MLGEVTRVQWVAQGTAHLRPQQEPVSITYGVNSPEKSPRPGDWGGPDWVSPPT